MAKFLPPKVIVLVLVLAGLTLPLTWKAKSLEKKLFGRVEESALLNKPAPEFQLETLDGQPVSSTDFRGKKLVVNFWASWCGPCRMELPALQAFYEKYHADNKNFEVVAISTDDTRREAQRYVQEAKLTFPILWDRDGKVQDAYGVEGIPTLFVIDENGKITQSQSGFDFGLEFRLTQALGLKFTPGTVEQKDDSSD